MLTAIGVALGIAAALASSRVLASLVFGITPPDSLTMAVAAVTLGASALIAAWIPARRAAARSIRFERCESNSGIDLLRPSFCAKANEF